MESLIRAPFSAWRDFNHFENVPIPRSACPCRLQDIQVSLIVSPVTFDSAERYGESWPPSVSAITFDRLPLLTAPASCAG
jgi:hypothetical protein